MLCVLLGAAIIVALGIFDDVAGARRQLKFVVQIVAAAIPGSASAISRLVCSSNLNPAVGYAVLSISAFWQCRSRLSGLSASRMR